MHRREDFVRERVLHRPIEFVDGIVHAWMLF
jgi:hypothetical protein